MGPNSTEPVETGLGPAKRTPHSALRKQVNQNPTALRDWPRGTMAGRFPVLCVGLVSFRVLTYRQKSVLCGDLSPGVRKGSPRWPAKGAWAGVQLCELCGKGIAGPCPGFSGTCDLHACTCWGLHCFLEALGRSSETALSCLPSSFPCL